ncbi:hypothetical protein ILUMI_21192 [Ignelater luminosus]|uniref:GPI ethanolamine phosphate transferase 1 n=1 Tax=Ignelater luminosus TaxID=2038154 RepID=A0A8K0G3U2_IGNLU|nr:hypothetical protein ILUMI_21192 [Ignelater luminosus]
MGVPKRLWYFAIIGVCVHLLLLSAVFDIYFVSPIQHGMTPHKAKGQAPAKRVVLFIADGLRADSLYNSEMQLNAPYLYSIKENIGSWGISHTQVPTESRPGHIAILAGFNEDPSAITRGWQSNPVDFDSIINQSTNAWCWGSPDIVNMFNKDNLSHIHLYSYDAYMQDFSGKESPALLDKWVFDRVYEFVGQYKRACKEFCHNGNIMFLHLLGLDTAGHSIKPTSDKYIENIKIVDKGVQDTVNLIEKYFGDKKTTYIFTSDHGMTDWGSHGDGSLYETEVPFIAWGASIPRSKVQYDLHQADIASLISSLVGLNIPMNSIGIVPVSYLDISESQKAHIIHANVRQLSEQYIMKHRNLKENTIPLIFQPYPELPSESSFYEQLAILDGLVQAQQYQRAVILSYDLINLFRDGLKYYYNYYQRVLLIFVTVGFVGWIIYLFSSITELDTNSYANCQWRVSQYPHIPKKPFLLFGLILAVCLIPFVYTLPLLYYVYFYFPIFTWLTVVKNYRQVLTNSILLGMYSGKELMFIGAVYLMGIQLLILTFFKSYYLTFVFVYFSFHTLIKKSHEFSSLLWVLAQLLLGVCPLMLGMQIEFNVLTQTITCGLWLSYGLIISSKPSFKRDRRVFAYQFALLGIAFMNSIWVHLTITHGIGLLLINQLISWLLLAITFVFPMLISGKLENRVISAIVSLMTPYVLMAVGYESMFMFFFAQHMLNWLSVEHKEMKLKHPNDPALEHYLTTSYRNGYTDKGSVKRCYYLLTFIMLSYFGVGNTASMSSFDPMWVRCFVTVFSPFTMSGLILIKLVIPFLLVMCAFRGIMIITRSQIQNTFLIILLFCDLMVLQFLYFVKNEGSWLEIGVSLSRFIVVNVTTIMLLVLYQIAIILTSKDLRKHPFAKYLKKYFGIYTMNEF